jgi:hypothetical protein
MADDLMPVSLSKASPTVPQTALDRNPLNLINPIQKWFPAFSLKKFR